MVKKLVYITMLFFILQTSSAIAGADGNEDLKSSNGKILPPNVLKVLVEQCLNLIMRLMVPYLNR